MFSLIIYILIAAIGFMMGFVYKRTHTTSQFFNPDPKKALRAFLILLGTAVLVTLALSWFTTYSLHSTNIPEEGAMKFQNTKSVVVFFINLFFFLLVVFANAYSQALNKLSVIPYLFALGFYVAFVLTDAYFISDHFVLWQKSLQLFHADTEDLHNTGRIKCVFASVVTTFNAFMIWWGMRK